MRFFLTEQLSLFFVHRFRRKKILHPVFRKHVLQNNVWNYNRNGVIAQRENNILCTTLNVLCTNTVFTMCLKLQNFDCRVFESHPSFTNGRLIQIYPKVDGVKE
jgi:hypothetical protein